MDLHQVILESKLFIYILFNDLVKNSQIVYAKMIIIAMLLIFENNLVR